MFKKIRQYFLKRATQSEIEAEFLLRYSDDIHADEISPEQESIIMADIGNVPNIDELIKSILKKDRVRFFNSPVESQGMVKGAFMRTVWLLKSARVASGRK